MAIPRHRIQYFSYKGQCVWDKDSRTDHVFGSTGQPVIFPFDKGAHAQGETQSLFRPCLNHIMHYESQLLFYLIMLVLSNIYLYHFKLISYSEVH